MVAHAAEPGDGGDPRPGEGGDVHAVACVVLEIVQVHQGGFPEVVVGKVDMADLGSDHSLRGSGQR